jgi:hypothetical protein
MGAGRITSAGQSIEDQFNAGDGIEFSLDAMWRAVGSPEGKSPADWMELAGEMVRGMVAYHARLADQLGRGSEERLIWKVTIESIRESAEYCKERGYPWEYDRFQRDGDTVAIRRIADCYAFYLDAEHYDDWDTIELI